LLSNLVDKSLVMVVDVEGGTEARYRMLAPIRQYAREKMDAAGEGANIAARHLSFFTQLAEQVETELMGPQQGLLLRRLEIEHDNVRAALSWKAQVREHAEQQLRMAGALWRFWYVRGNIIEGQELLSTALHENPTAAPAARAKGYTGLGAMEWLRGDYEEAVFRHGQALALYRETDDTRGIALSLDNIGIAFVYQEEFEKAVSFLEESLALARGLGDRILLTAILNGLAEVARYQGDYARAQALNEETLAVATEIQHHQQIALSLNNLGLIETQRGNFARAAQLLQEALVMYRLCEEIRLVPECLEALAGAWSALGQTDGAGILLGASDALRASIQLPMLPVERGEYERVLARVREDMHERFDSAWAKGHAMTMDQAIDFALDKRH
jgi:tetratricopeptide (TPR) repeat protein